MFKNLKNDTEKKKDGWIKANKSVTSSAAVEKLEQDFEKYNLFKWYEEFIRPSASKSNVLSSIDSEEEDLDEYDSL